MFQRRMPFLTAAVLTAALALAGCGSSKSGGDKASGPLKDVTVSGGSAKQAPTVTIKPKPLSVKQTTTRVVKDGSGAALKGNEIVSLKYVMLNGKDGAAADNNYGKPDLGLNLAQQGLLPGLKKGLTGQKVGSRLLVAMPPADAFGSQGNPQLKIGASDTLVFLMDVLSTQKALKTAEGKAVAPVTGLPTVKFTEGKPATITVPKTTPPTQTVVQPLIQGTGKKVQAGQTVRVTYTGALWKDGSIFDASASHPEGYFEFPVGRKQVINAWDTKLVGQNIGSRLLLVVPPADGYGAAGSPPKISGKDTLVFVIDILAAY